VEHHIQIACSDSSPTVNYDFYFKRIIPKFIIEDGVPKVITDIHERYYLEGFIIKRFNNKLADVRVIGIHPNADISTGSLCLKDEEKTANILNIEALKDILISRLEVYYFNECHFRPDAQYYNTKPVDGFMKIDVNFEKGEIHNADTSFRQLYPA